MPGSYLKDLRVIATTVLLTLKFEGLYSLLGVLHGQISSVGRRFQLLLLC